MILRSALRAGRCLRRVPLVQLIVEHGEPYRAPHRCATDTRDVEESSAVLNWWGVTPVGHGYQLRAYSAAPAARVRGEKPLDRADAVVMADEEVKRMKKMRVFRTAQRTFMEYLHVTRGLSFLDAEHISKHSPAFVSKLLNQVKDAIKDPVEGDEAVFRSKVKTREMRDERATTALQRLFRYHPINEFEPFFESMGFKPSEYESFLPQDLMFLSDDETLLENYHVLCNYGVMRTKIGGIYRDAGEVFSFGDGVLASKLRAIEDLGFSKTTVIKLVTCCPAVLTRGPHAELKILKWLDDIGIQRDWIGQFLSVKKSYNYNWRKMVEVPQFFTELGFDKEGIGKLIRQHPDFLLDGSGKVLFRAVAIMLKAGSGKEDLFNLFMDFPDVQARSFARNIQSVILFLTGIDVSEEDIKKFVVANASMLGSARVKKANSILTYLNVGKKRLWKIIMEEPRELMKYALGLKVNRLPPCDRTEKSLKEKVKFLKNIGFEEGSDDMNKAVKAFRGKGDELQDRFDFLVKTGFEPKDVANMIKVAPQVLNQKIHVLESKISFLLNETSYPLSSLVGYPAFLSFTIERTKARFLMYNWLQERGLVPPNFALSTLLACSEKRFLNYLVLKHHEGPEVWEKLKKEVAADKNVHCTSDD